MGNELPKATQERIKADADKAYPIANGWHTDYAVNMGYIAGATAEAALSQRMADLLESAVDHFKQIKAGLSNIWPETKHVKIDWLDEAEGVLQQFKDGKGKGKEEEIKQVNPLVLLHNPQK